MRRVVIVSGRPFKVSLLQNENSLLWTATGEYEGEQLVAVGHSKGDALLNWRDDALAKSGCSRAPNLSRLP